MQPLELGESVVFNEAHVVISQDKHNRVMWFERIPQIGELVVFPPPRGRGAVCFRVDQVQHYPVEVGSLPASATLPQGLIALRPILVK